MSLSSENPMSACTFLLWKVAEFVARGVPLDAPELSFALYDLGTKAMQLEGTFRRSILRRVEEVLGRAGLSIAEIAAFAWLKNQLSSNQFSLDVDQKDSLEKRIKPRADVAIVTVINEERKAARKVFGVDQAQPSFDIDGRNFYATTIPLAEREFGNREISAYLTMVGEPRNVPCANVCRDIIDKLNVDLLLLCGIAGGNRERKILLSQVVAPYSVFYVEGGKSQIHTRFLRRFYGVFGNRIDWLLNAFRFLFGRERYTEPEIITKNMMDPVKAYLQNFEPEQAAATELCASALDTYSKDELAGADLSSRYACHRTNVMCGEKVLVDDGLRKISDEVNRKIYAVDMESYGFAAACEHRRKPWIIFRGISDYADPKKDDSRHIPASVAAAATAKLFLRAAYKLPEERSDF